MVRWGGKRVSYRELMAWNDAVVAVRPCVRGMITGLLMVILWGCREHPRTYPVSGSVYYQDQPAAHVDLVFYNAGSADAQALRPYATSDPQGQFTVSTYGVHDGAPAGDYEVAFSWKGPLRGLSSDQRDGMPERLPARYLDPATSGVRLEIIRGENRLETLHLYGK